MSNVMNTPKAEASVQVLPIDLLRKFDHPGPRYTSYPTADRFVESFTAEDYVLSLEQRSHGAGIAKPLSIYVHIPFCESLCYYCACNKVITRHPERAATYLDYLIREIQMQARHLGGKASVSQLHFGGGTPTYLSDAQLARLWHALQEHFRLMPGGEYSIEVDPRTVDRTRLQFLARLGFNRISFGVQDFDPVVQKAVHRVQSFEQVQGLMTASREVGFESVNIDLIYGLPHQSVRSFSDTLRKTHDLLPDRIAVYSYAHLPQRFKPQRRIAEADLPGAAVKTQMAALTIEYLGSAGYVYVGMDHFALPTDALAVAKRQGRLHRNFQGYSTQPDADLIALGVSAIGRVGPTYSQNAKEIDEYYDLLDQGRLPIVRGMALSHDDLMRRAVIMAIMCQGQLSYESIEVAFLIEFQRYFAWELTQLQAMQDEGLVQLQADGFNVTAKGWYVVRAVAMLFDRYLQADKMRTRYSRII